MNNNGIDLHAHKHNVNKDNEDNVVISGVKQLRKYFLLRLQRIAMLFKSKILSKATNH